jgi:hypothetical protein
LPARIRSLGDNNLLAGNINAPHKNTEIVLRVDMEVSLEDEEEET